VRCRCCIDKTDLTELSESINSMFRWYKNAAICYAYLSDARDDDVPPERRVRFGSNVDDRRRYDPAFELEASEKLLSACRWFQRGWTLQELIAPPRIVFYSQNWYRLGPRPHLETLLSSITGINRLVIAHYDSLSAICIAERMSWAARRKTTRREDIAYCLLGIFDVNMPLLYGEGDRAFLRLQEEIMKVHGDQSLFAWGFTKDISPMDLDMEHPLQKLKPPDILPDVFNISGFFASSPKDFELGSLVGGQSHIGDRSTGDYPLPPMMMSGGLRIELPTLCAADLEMTPAECYKGMSLCELAYKKNLVVFAVLNCQTRIPSYLGSQLAIPLIALDSERLCRFGEPVVLRLSHWKNELETRRKILFIRAPPDRRHRQYKPPRYTPNPIPTDLQVQIGRRSWSTTQREGFEGC
jgi:Heterokaryon incompatibility protein (HET)